MIVLEKGYVLTPSVHARLMDYIIKCCHTLNFDLDYMHKKQSVRIQVAQEFKRCLSNNKDFIDDLLRLRRYDTSSMYLTIELVGKQNLPMKDIESRNIHAFLKEKHNPIGDLLNVYVSTVISP